MKKQNVRTLTLIVSTFSYLLVGAAIFDALESDAEDLLRITYQATQNKTLRMYNISESEYAELEDIVLRYTPHKAGAQWKFSGAFYFSLTVITTIGYGHSCPTTIWGKSFCMLYAVIGIPLCLVMFQSVGERLNNFASWCIKAVKKCIQLRNYESTQTELVIVGTVLAVGVVTGGAAMFRYYENWSYFDSVYYCFITLTTIGFGDFVALQTNGTLNNNIFYVILCMTFILFGLTVVASSMNLLVLRFLTMNTEDERREEIQSAVARSSLKYENDFINCNGTSIEPFYSNEIDYLSTELSASEFESSPCFCCFKYPRKDRRKFTVRRMPGKIAHLVPMERFDSTLFKRNISFVKPSISNFHCQSSNKLTSAMPTTAPNLEMKSSIDDSFIRTWSRTPVVSSSHPPVENSTSTNSIRPSNIIQYDPTNVYSQMDLKKSFLFDSTRLHIKRSSV